MGPGYCGLCLRARRCKLLFVLIASLLLLRYAFIPVFDARHLEPLFVIYAPVGSRAVPLPLAGAALGGRATSPSADEGTGTAAVDDAKGGDVAWAPPASTLLSKPLLGRTRCPIIPPHPNGPLRIPLMRTKLTQVDRVFRHLEAGGAWRPHTCTARHRVAIVIPYRDRAAHLAVLLQALHPFLQRQQLDYRIVVVEQAGNLKFNRAMLLNVGFVEALKLYDFQCFIFHDVDLLPEDNRNLYTCPEQPRHMSVSVSSLSYRLPQAYMFGGVTAMTKVQFLKVNGFSNMFWGWGGEDNEMSQRIRSHGFRIARYPAYVARYKMLEHSQQPVNLKRIEMLHTDRKRFKTDGLNSLRYKRKKLTLFHSYTWVLVELAYPSGRMKLRQHTVR